MKIKKTFPYLCVIIFHSILIFIGFNTFFKHPEGTSFCNYGDGLKNTFTMISYVKEPISKDGFFKYNSICYPYGDYVYYTDNTPLFSIPFRFICHYIIDLSDHTNTFFNLFIILNFLFCGLLVFYVFSKIFNENIFSFIMAIVLPWTSMQVMRITCGHFNLSISALMMLAILLMMMWHNYREKRKKQLYIGAFMVLLSFFAFFIHGYYFAIITIFIAAMLFIYGIKERKLFAGKFSIVASVVYSIVATLVTLLVLLLTDKYLSIRQDNAMGYDWMEQKIRFSALFSHYSFHTLFFPITPASISNDAEKAGYLGNIGLFTVFISGLGTLLSKKFRNDFITIQGSFFKNPLFSAILGGSIVLLFISFGEVYTTSTNYNDAFKIINVLNPFFYVHFFTLKVEQFRSLERFIYPFFFGFYVWITHLLISLYRLYSLRNKTVLVFVVILFGGIETGDFVNRMLHGTDIENHLDKENVKAIKTPNVNYAQYQAILPIPFYCAGSEDYDYTIDVDDLWSQYNYKLCLSTGLPLMSFVTSRVPPSHNISLLNYIANDTMNQELSNRMNDKPVLVVVNKELILNNNNNIIPGRKKAAELFYKTCKFAQRNNLTLIDSDGVVNFYIWYPKKR